MRVDKGISLMLLGLKSDAMTEKSMEPTYIRYGASKSPLLVNYHILCTYYDTFTLNLHGKAKRLSFTAPFMESNSSKNTLFCLLSNDCPHGK